MRIAIDAMGGELGVQAAINGIDHAIQILRDPALRFVVFGRKSAILPLVEKTNIMDRVDIVDVEDVVLDTDHPFKIFQTGNNTSMGQALLAVKDGIADGVVSSGSTGGYVTLAHKIFGLMPNVSKIALPAIIPTHKGQSIFLDLGASIIVSEHDLAQFAVMGSLLYVAQFGKQNPTVGLLNIGTEDIKGPPFLTKAHKLLRTDSVLNYQGFIEGTDIFNGEIDVIVTDGYAGNIALKTMEGTASFIVDHLKAALGGSVWAKILAFGLMGSLKQFKTLMDRRRYNGAVLLGLNYLAVKSHGSADAKAFSSAICVAYQVIQQNLVQQVRTAFEKVQAESNQ